MTDSVPTVTAPIPTKTVRKQKDGKAARIRKLLAQGKKSRTEIARIVGTTPGYVHGVARRIKNNPKTAKKIVLVATSNVSVKTTPQPRKVGRPRKYPVVVAQPVFARAPTLWERIKVVFTRASHA